MPYWVTVPCASCGTETEITKFLSTHSIGSGDLDMRSAGMHGLILSAQVQRCPGCGYCASDVSVVYPDAQAVISSQEYRDQLNDPAYPELANSFLCQAILLDRALRNNHVESAWARIKAAWVCDDSNHSDPAIACRRRAEISLAVAEARNLNPAVQDEKNVAIRVDLLRRSKQVYAARKLISDRRGKITDDLIKCILGFQSELLDKNDFSRHTIAEARSHFKEHSSGVAAGSTLNVIASTPKEHKHEHSSGTSTAEPDVTEHQAAIEKHGEQIGANLSEGGDAEIIWSDFDVRDLTWEDYQREKANEKFVAQVQGFMDVLRKDGADAAEAYLKNKIKAEDEAKKKKARWDEFLKIAGIVLVTAFFVTKCNDSTSQNDCYNEYGKYGAERICE